MTCFFLMEQHLHGKYVVEFMPPQGGIFLKNDAIGRFF